MYGQDDQGYYCQMGPPPPMAQPATMSPQGTVMYQQQQQNHYDIQNVSGDLSMSVPPGSSHLTILPPPPQSPLYGTAGANGSMPGTPMTQGPPFSPGSNSMSPQNIFGQQQSSPQMPDSTNYGDLGPTKQAKPGQKGYRGKVAYELYRQTYHKNIATRSKCLSSTPVHDAIVQHCFVQPRRVYHSDVNSVRCKKTKIHRDNQPLSM